MKIPTYAMGCPDPLGFFDKRQKMSWWQRFRWWLMFRLVPKQARPVRVDAEVGDGTPPPVVPLAGPGSVAPPASVGPNFSAQYNKTYNSFSGTDCNPWFVKPCWKGGRPRPEYGHTAVQEMQGISFDEDLRKNKVTGHRKVRGVIICTFFDQDPLAFAWKRPYDLILRFVNEYGHEVTMRLRNLQINSRSMGVSIDDLMIDVAYTFEADALECPEAGPTEKRAYVA